MSKGSGGTRATNSRSAHGAREAKGENKYESPILNNGKSASTLSDKALEDRYYRAMNAGNAESEYGEESRLLREIKHRADGYVNKAISEINGNVDAYNKIVSDMKANFGTEMRNPQMNFEKAQAKISLKKDKPRYEKFLEMRDKLVNLDKAIKGKDVLQVYINNCSESVLKNYASALNKKRINT